ncbi:MAG: isoamylase early set domain-containing protein [Ferruginibacter sp.]
MTKKKIKFRLSPECINGATEGLLLGEFNNWNPAEGVQLKKAEDGSFVAELSLTPGKTYEYRYLLNDGRWVNDSNATAFSQQFGPSVENCVLTVPGQPIKNPAVTKPKAVKKEKADAAAEDLTKIEGLQKKVLGLLAKENIKTFKDLSKCTIKKLQLILDGAGETYNIFDPATWPKQAKLAASGNWKALNKLQEEIKGTK